jgi:hypothetical protein
MLNPAHRFHAAVLVLCGRGELKQRLISAYQDHLADLEDSELPNDVRQIFSELRERLSCVAPLNGEGAIRASVRKMSVDEADKCARLVAEIHIEVMRLVDDTQATLPLEVAEQTAAAPPFLVKSG